jgi:hypothetical protein
LGAGVKDLKFISAMETKMSMNLIIYRMGTELGEIRRKSCDNIITIIYANLFCIYHIYDRR